MWAGFLAALKAVPAAIALIKGIFSLAGEIKEAIQRKKDEKEIQRDIDSTNQPGGRPTGP